MKNKSIIGENRIKIYIIAGIICIICIILLKPVILAKVHEIIVRFYSAELTVKDLGFNYPRKSLFYYQNAIGKTLTSIIWGAVITFPLFLLFYLPFRKIFQVKTCRFKGILSIFLFIWLITVNALVYYHASNLKVIYKDIRKSYFYRHKKKIPGYEFMQFCNKVIPPKSKFMFIGHQDLFFRFRYYLYPRERISSMEGVKTAYIIVYKSEIKDLRELLGERKIFEKRIFSKDEYILSVKEKVRKK